MATFVLVHGAFVGAFSWQWVRPLLEAAGHTVHTPILTGLGERAAEATPEVTLETHISDVVDALTSNDLREVILLGWSYGGMPVAGAADRVPDRIAHLVSFDSDIPRDGDTSVPPGQYQARRDRSVDGWRVPPPVEFVRQFLGPLPSETRDWVLGQLTPHLLRTWLEPIHLTGAAAAIPTTYIRCLDGYDPENEDTMRQDARIRSEPTWTYLELPDSHFVNWTRPEALADILLAIAAGRQTAWRRD